MSTHVLHTPQPSLASIYWRAIRAFSFPASVVSLLLGTALAAVSSGTGIHFHPLACGLVLLGGLLAHAGANVFNDYFDFMKGVDTRPEHGSGVLPAGLLTPGQMRRFGTFLMAGAALCGVVLLASHSLQLAFASIVGLALLGFACALLYPMLLKRYALGDLLIVLAFGLGMPLGAFVAQADVVDTKHILFVLIASLPTSALVDAILHANNRRDREDDRAAGVRTLATLLPEAGSQGIAGNSVNLSRCVRCCRGGDSPTAPDEFDVPAGNTSAATCLSAGNRTPGCHVPSGFRPTLCACIPDAAVVEILNSACFVTP